MKINLQKAKKYVILILLVAISTICSAKNMDQYSKEEICSAIWIVEGGENTNYPYGIKSVNCDGKEDCKNVCYNTVINNRVRYADYGNKQYDTYLEFLQSRYCPLRDAGCENWLPNLNYYLNKGK